MRYDTSIVKTGRNEGYLSPAAGTISLNVSKIRRYIGRFLSYIEAEFYKFKCHAPRDMAKCVKEQWLRQGPT
jgi:hypothetical protein